MYSTSAQVWTILDCLKQPGDISCSLEQYWYWGQSQTKGRSKALPLFIAMRGISSNFLVHLPSWHDELRVCKEKSNKITINVSKCNTFGENFKFGNCFTTSMKTRNLLWGDMKKNLIKGRSLESLWTVLKCQLYRIQQRLYNSHISDALFKI